MSSRVRSILRRRPSAFQLLASGNYRNYWINRGFSDLGLGFWFLGAAWLTLDLTDSQAWVGLVGGIAAIPAIAVSLFGGALSDRSDRRTIITRTQLALMLIAASIAALVLVDGIEPWHLVVGALAIGLADGLGAPAYGAFVVDLVGRDRVFAANSMAQFANFSGEIVGPLIVGALIATIGIGSVFVTALASSAIALLFILRVAARPALPAVAADRTGVFADIQAGVIYTWRTPGLTPLIAVAASGLFSAAVLPLIPVYARDVLGVGGSGFGVLMAALGGGFIAGSLLGAISGGVSHRGLVLLMLALIWDAGIVGFAFSGSYPLSVGLLFLMGTAGALSENLIMTSIQSMASDETRGRVLSILRIADSFNPLGMILGGVLASIFTSEFALVVSASLAFGVVALAVGLSSTVRRM